MQMWPLCFKEAHQFSQVVAAASALLVTRVVGEVAARAAFDDDSSRAFSKGGEEPSATQTETFDFSSLWTEAAFFIATLAMVAFVTRPKRREPNGPSKVAKRRAAKAPESAPSPSPAGPTAALAQAEDVAEVVRRAEAGETPARVVESWRSASSSGPLSQELLRRASTALATISPELAVEECSEYLVRLGDEASAKWQAVTAVIDGIGVDAKRPDVAEQILDSMSMKGRPLSEMHRRDLLLSVYAGAGHEAKVEELLALERLRCASLGATVDPKAAARPFALAVKGFLGAGKVMQALALLLELQKGGRDLPPSAVTELLLVALARNALGDVFDTLENDPATLTITSESVGAVLQECVRLEDLFAAKRLEALARSRSIVLNHTALEAMLKLLTQSEQDVDHAAELLKEMRPAGGLCGALLARCSETQNITFAEVIKTYLRSHSMMTLPSYKTLMKVYACGGQYEKACDLYEELLLDGVEPDSVMYGCLVKFAVKCGRTQLSETLFEKAGGGCVQNYMWLIRAAGRDGDAAKAVQLLRQLEATQPGAADVMTYNCALDACIVNNELAQATELINSMKARGLGLNLVTHNTLMKGHCANGDLRRAKALMQEMEAQGLVPDTASYNSLISAAITGGQVEEVWKIIDMMDRRGIVFDQYTVSIVMKAARRAKNAQDAERALRFLDRAQVSVCEDEVLFNTVLDACIHRKDKTRLRRSLDTYSASSMRPSVRTYGLLIKASSILKDTKICRRFWVEMTQSRKLEPNDITLSCMIDALIEGKSLEDAVSIFQEWKGRVPPNTIIYSTLIKGFAAAGDTSRAMAAYDDMVAEGCQMNMVAYTALIDANARTGNMQNAERLFKQMEKDGCQPNTITYSNLVKGYCLKGNLQEALRCFRDMLARGIRADTVIVNTMLDGCVRHDRFELADQLLVDMPTYGVEPSNFTLSIVVKMWGKRKQVDTAFQVIRDAVSGQRGRTVDALVGACLVGACLNNGLFERALEALGEIKATPKMDGPCVGTYGALVCGFARSGRVAKAVELAEEACGLRPGGPRPPPLLKGEPLRHLFKALHQNGQSRAAQDLFAQFKAAGCPVESRWLTPM